jgi:hypothetical protein
MGIESKQDLQMMEEIKQERIESGGGGGGWKEEHGIRPILRRAQEKSVYREIDRQAFPALFP